MKPTTISRRQFGIAAGSVALTTSGAVALTRLSAPARALEVTSFEIDGATYEADDGQLYTPWLSATVEYDYRVNDDVGEARALLMVGPGNDREVIDMVSQPISGREGTGSFDMAAPLIDAEQYDSSDFDVADPGDTTTVTVDVAARVDVRGLGDTILAAETAKATVAIETVHTGKEPEVVVSVVGAVAFQGDASDPPPV